jgi:hypothetical protein
MFDTLITSIEHIRTGKLRALAVTAATRVEVLYPDYRRLRTRLRGGRLAGSRRSRTTPVEIIDKLNEATNAGLADPRIKSANRRLRLCGVCKLACRLR